MKNDDGQGAQIGFEYQAEIDVDLTNWRFHKVHFFSFSPFFFFPPFFLELLWFQDFGIMYK